MLLNVLRIVEEITETLHRPEGGAGEPSVFSRPLQRLHLAQQRQRDVFAAAAAAAAALHYLHIPDSYHEPVVASLPSGFFMCKMRWESQLFTSLPAGPPPCPSLLTPS